MKWIKATLIPIGLIVLIFLIAHAGRVQQVNYYATYGWTASEMMQIVVDSSTTIGYEIKRDIMHVPLTTTSAGVDTVVDQLFAVPAGQTLTIEEINLSAHTEIDEATDTLHIQIVRYGGTVKATLDTVVASLVVDDDSSTVYADTIFTMTLVDSVFTAGDILQAWLMAPGGAISAGDGAGLTIKYRIAE